MCLSFSLFISSNVLSKVINVGIDLWPGYYPIILAKHLGLFKKRGLTVNYILPESTDNMLGKFIARELDMVCVAMGDAFSLYNQDNDLRIVMITDESAGGDALLARDKNISITNTTIGTNLKGFGELFVQEFLKQKNVNPKSVKIVQQEASNAVNALQTNKVDIVHTWEPYVTDAVSYNVGRVIFDSSKTPGLIPDALLANGNFIKQHPEQLSLFIEAWLEASQWWVQNRYKGDSIIESEMVMMPGSVNLGGVKLYNKNDNIKAFKLGSGMQSLGYVTQIYIDFFVQKGSLNKGVKPKDILDDRFIPH